jgi:voltage-gated potassium channel
MDQSLTSAEHARRQARVERAERYTELPLMLLAFTMIPLLLGHVLFDLSETEQRVFTILDVMIWALFAIDLVIKLALAPNRMSYLKSRWLQALVVVLPFFRPLIVLRVVVYGSRAVIGVRRVLGFSNLTVFAIGLILMAATVVLAAEQGKNPEIDSFSDALWWAFVTISTVGYGDMVPTTVTGRIVAIVVMMGGIAFFGAIAGNLASALTRDDQQKETVGEQRQEQMLEELMQEVRELRGEVARLGSGTRGG